MAQNKHSAAVRGAVAGIRSAMTSGPARNLVLVDRVSSSRAAPGQTVYVDMRGTPDTDAQGRYAHVRGIYIEAKAYVTAADGTTAAITALDIRSLFSQIGLTDCFGHEYFAAPVDARDLLDDSFARANSLITYPNLRYGTQGAVVPAVTDNGIAANVGAGQTSAQASFYFPLTNPRRSRSVAGLVSLASLKARGGDAFRFTVLTNFNVTHTDLTFDYFKNYSGVQGLNVYLDLVYLPVVVSDAPTLLASYTLKDLAGQFLYGDQITEHLCIRGHSEDANGANTYTGLLQAMAPDGVTVRAGNQMIIPALSRQEVINRTLFIQGMDPDSALTRQNAALSLPLYGANGDLYMSQLLPYRGRDGAATGQLSYVYTSVDGANYLRYLQRCVAPHKADRAAAIVDAAEIGGSRVETFHLNDDGDAMHAGESGSATAPLVIIPRK